MNKIILILSALVALSFPVNSSEKVSKVSLGTPIIAKHKKIKKKDINDTYWMKLWIKRDRSIYTANRVAARSFGVSESLLNTIVGGEGGNINPTTLRTSLCRSYGKGWNNSGSSAFGPFQFMLGSRPACFNSSRWGTFGAYDDSAWKTAKKLHLNVPHRFMHPASNVGQAITAAYMLATPSTGGISHWCASLC